MEGIKKDIPGDITEFGSGAEGKLKAAGIYSKRYKQLHLQL